MDKMNARDLVKAVSEETGCSQKMVEKILKSSAAIVESKATNGVAVAFPVLGKFYPADRAPRTMNNPLTGTRVDVPAKRVLLFKASAGMKELSA